MMKTESLKEFIRTTSEFGVAEKEDLLEFCEEAVQIDCSNSMGLFFSPYEKREWEALPPFKTLILQLHTTRLGVSQPSVSLIKNWETKVEGETVRYLLSTTFLLLRGKWTIGADYLYKLTMDGKVGAKMHVNGELLEPNWEHRIKATQFYKMIIHLYYVMGASNVELVVNQPDKKLNKHRVNNGKTPFREYHTINLLLPNTRKQSAPAGGTHASPIPHSRRSHRRILKSGKEIWVRDCQVMCSPKDATPQRTYEVHYTV